MSFIINPDMSYTFTAPTIVSTSAFRSTTNQGSSYSFSLVMTFNAFRVYTVHWENGSNVSTLTSASVNGLSPTIITQTHVQQGGTGCGIALLQLRYPLSSATHTFTLNFTNNCTAVGVGQSTIFRNSSDTPYSFQTTTIGASIGQTFFDVPVLAKSLNIIAATNLINSSITFSNTTPPTMTTPYNLPVPATSSQFQMGLAQINNGASATEYNPERVTIQVAAASACFATVSYI